MGAIDMWSVGCIFAELLEMLEGMHQLDRGPLFPGSSCFPLSPHHRHKTDYKYHTQGKEDMLNKIFTLLGTPADEDYECIQRDDARRYLQQFVKRPAVGLRKHLEDLGCQPDGHSLDLLDKMLKFNPARRINVNDALDHTLFADIRQRDKETTKESMVVLPFEKEDNLNEGLLRRYFWMEVGKYHPDEIETANTAGDGVR